MEFFDKYSYLVYYFIGVIAGYLTCYMPNRKKLQHQSEAPKVSKHEQANVIPSFCFVCGSKLEEVGLGWLQCEDEKCGEVFLPYIDKENNQCLMHQCTPFS